MTGHQLSWERVLALPELFEAIVQYMEPGTIRSLRLVNKTFLELCIPHFFITLSVDNSRHYPEMKWILDRHYRALETAQERDPLDLIQSVRVYEGHSGYSKIDPRGMSVLLNRCRNIRRIKVGDIGSEALPKRPSYPARMLWPDLMNHGYRLVTGTPDPDHGDLMDGKPWSNWDLLPLEGTCLHRLEKLLLVEGARTPLDLDRFMGRLQRSCVVKTLRVLSITGEMDQGRRVSFSAFRKCICSLKRLETLELSGILIKDTDGSVVRGQDVCAQEQDQQWIAPKVKELFFSCVVSVDIKLALFALLPNVEALTTNLGDLFQDIDQKLFPDNINRSSWPTSPTPFPHLKKLDAPISETRNWAGSRTLQAWVRGHPHFEVDSLKDDRDAVDALVHEAFTVKTMQFFKRDLEWVTQVLTLPVCRSMDDLWIACDQLDSASVLVATCKRVELRSPRSWTQREVFGRLPWSRTLTRLYFLTALDSRLEADQGEGTLELMRTLLQFLPRLTHLKIKQGLRDLALFEGLGRVTGTKVTDDETANALTVSSIGCVEDRPCLTDLMVAIEFSAYMSEVFEYEVRDAWSEKLHSSFRFLKTLDVVYEMGPRSRCRRRRPG